MQLDHCVSVHRKTFVFATKCPLALKHFEIHGKTFTVQGKNRKIHESFVPRRFCTIGYTAGQLIFSRL